MEIFIGHRHQLQGDVADSFKHGQQLFQRAGGGGVQRQHGESLRLLSDDLGEPERKSLGRQYGACRKRFLFLQMSGKQSGRPCSHKAVIQLIGGEIGKGEGPERAQGHDRRLRLCGKAVSRHHSLGPKSAAGDDNVKVRIGLDDIESLIDGKTEIRGKALNRCRTVFQSISQTGRQLFRKTEGAGSGEKSDFFPALFQNILPQSGPGSQKIKR